MSWIIVGLGNPGAEYEHSRHNVGRMVVDEFYRAAGKDGDLADWKADPKTKALRSAGKVDGESVTLLKPETMMNNSGDSVKDLAGQPKKLERLAVVYDDLDLPLGAMKISFDRGSGGHRGLESVIKRVKSRAFVRVRVGISPATPAGKLRKPAGEDRVIDFILGEFKPPEKDKLKKVAKRAAEALLCLITDGREAAMGKFN